MNKVKKLITHNGSFHSDDIFACAALILMLERQNEKYEVIRTRDEDIIKTGDYVFDVGGVHDENKNLFDHHQKGGAGKGPQGIEYSSFGLVWKKFGKEIAGSEEAAGLINERLAAPIDAWDNGIDLVENKNKITPYYIQNAFFAMQPTWQEEDLNIDDMFLKSVELAKEILIREITQAKAVVEAEKAVIVAYETSADKRLVILDKNYPFEFILIKFPEPLFAVFPRKTGGTWGLKAVRQDIKSFNNRKDLPAAWGGLKNEELQELSGVPEAVFCHRGLFMAVATTKEGAIKLGRIAVES